MTHHDLAQKILDEIHHVDGVVSIIYKDFDTNLIPFQFAPDYVMPAADMIKIPILLAALMRVEEGAFNLENCVIVPDLWISPDSVAFERGSMAYSIDELLSWMIIADEDTPANLLIELLGYDYINSCCRKFGMGHTSIVCHLGETDLPGDDYRNVTCAQDMLTFFENIYRNHGLSRWLCEYAGRLFLRQRDCSGFMRYICDDIYVGRKSAEMPTAGHEAGIFYLRYVDYFLAIFVSGTTDDVKHNLEIKKMRGRIANMIYNYYLEREDHIHKLPYNPNAKYSENRY